MLAVVHQLAVDLVRKDPEIALARDGRDVADRVTREHATRRVVGTVEDEHLGPRIHEPAELVDIGLEAVLLPKRKRHAARPGEIDHRRVDGEAGVGIDRLVAILEESQQGVEHDRLRARGDDHLPRIGSDAAPLLQIKRDRFTQLDHARRLGVMGLASFERRDTGRDDRRRRVEVRLADLQVNDVASLRLERTRSGQDLERGLRP